MIEVRVQKLDGMTAMALTPEMLSILNVEEGDPLYVVACSDGSLMIRADGPKVAAQIEVAERVMERNKALLKALAKS